MAAMKPRTGEGPLEVTKEGEAWSCAYRSRGRSPRGRAVARRGGGALRGTEGRDQLNTAANLPSGSSATDDTAPAVGSTPATGAAPLPRVEVLADLPVLGPGRRPGGAGRQRHRVAGLAERPGAGQPELLSGASDGQHGKPGTVPRSPSPAAVPAASLPSASGSDPARRPRLRRRRRPARRVARRARRAPPGHAAGQRRVPAGVDEVRAAVEAALLAGYRFRETSSGHPRRLAEVTLVAADAADPAVVTGAGAGRSRATPSPGPAT